MENNFLYQIAKKVYENHKKELGDICIVFPNKRAGLFFSKYLSELTEKPLWSPVFMTIRELMQEFSGLQLADPLHLIFKLYRIFRKEKKTEESFDEFYHWGEMLLNDFDEVDKYLVSAKDLFRNLSDLKEMDDKFTALDEEQIKVIKKFWKWFGPEKKSVQKEEFISLWEVLYRIYSKFREEIFTEGVAYEGMMYRQVAGLINKNDNLRLKFSRYIIVGFNALSKSEKELFQYLQNSGRAEFYWDRDLYYSGKGKEYQEAGVFVSENMENFPSSELDLSFNSILEEKNIEFIGVPSETGQAKIINHLLPGSIGDLEQLDYRTAIVLPDENLLMPVIYSLPEEIKDINITMGYPVKQTPVFGLVCNLIELQRSLKVNSKESPAFYFKTVLPVLSSDYIKNIAAEETNKIINDINSQNIIYWSPGKEIENELLKKIFSPVENINELSDYLIEIIEYFHKKGPDEIEEENLLTTLEKEYIFKVYTAIKRLKDVITEAKDIRLSIDIYYRLLKRYMRDMKIPFSGEPLRGLQVMGILETRTLDFENIFILSMNEGIFPKSQPRYSFIPFNLRKGFGLPTIEHQDSIYAYYFYRLIQRARNVFLIYNLSQEGLKTNEMSRYLTQLKYDEEIKVKEKVLGYKINIGIRKPISILKSGKTMKLLSEYIVRNHNAKNCLSPTGLNTYLDCPLKFYFRYVAKIKEQEEVTEEIDPMIFGSLLHNAVNLLYKSHINKDVEMEDIEGLLGSREKITNFVNQSFNKILFEGKKAVTENFVLSGKNIVIRDVLLNYVIKLLNADRKYSPFRIMGLEEFYKLDIPVTINNSNEKIRLGGTIDRIDMVDNSIRVIDYKTGATKNSVKSLDELFARGKENRERAILQTFIYSLMVKEQNQNKHVEPGIYSVRDIQNDDFDYHIYIGDKNRNEDAVNDISAHKSEINCLLGDLIAEIFDPETPFAQVESDKICKYCPYKGLCSRD